MLTSTIIVSDIILKIPAPLYNLRLSEKKWKQNIERFSELFS